MAMGALVSLGLIALPAAALAVLCKRRIEQTLAPACMLLILCMYAAGVAGALPVGIWLCAALAFAAGVYLVRELARRREPLGQWLITPGAVLFLLLYAGAWAAHAGRLFSSWDEFSHWGLVAKNMCTLDAMGNSAAATTYFKGYPPATALFQYLFCKLNGGFSEGAVFTATNVLFLALLVPVLRNVEWKSLWRAVPIVFCVWLVPTVFFPDFMVQIYVDALLGVWFAWLLYVWISERSLNAFSVFCLSLGCGVIALVKASGTGLALLALGIVAVDALRRSDKNDAAHAGGAARRQWKQAGMVSCSPKNAAALKNGDAVASQLSVDENAVPESGICQNSVTQPTANETAAVSGIPGAWRGRGLPLWVKLLLPAAAVLLGKQTWAWYLQATHTAEAWDMGGLTLSGVLQLVQGGAPAYRYTVLGGFFAKLFEADMKCGTIASRFFQMSVFAWLAVLALGGVWLVCGLTEKDDRVRTKHLLIGSFVGFGVYALSLLVLYLFTYMEYEALHLSSYTRYLSTYLTGMGLMLAYLIIEALCGGKMKARVERSLFAGGVVLMLLFGSLGAVAGITLFNRVDVQKAAALRAPLAEVQEAAKQAQLAPEADKVYLVAQHTKGFEYWVERYELTPVQTSPNYSWSLGEPYGDEDIWTRNVTAEAWASELAKEYTYVYVYEADVRFQETFGGLFDGPVENKTLYRVQKEGDTCTLQKAADGN